MLNKCRLSLTRGTIIFCFVPMGSLVWKFHNWSNNLLFKIILASFCPLFSSWISTYSTPVMSLHLTRPKKMSKQQTGMCSAQQKAFWTSREAMCWHTGAAALAAGCISPRMGALISEKSVTRVQGETSHIINGRRRVSSCLPTAKDTRDRLLIDFPQNQKRPRPKDKSAG